MRSFILAVFLSTPLSAQSLDPRYELIGKFDGQVQGNSVTLQFLFDRENVRSMVKLRDASGFATYSVSARAISDNGTPTRPSVQFTIGPIGAGSEAVHSDVFFSNETGYFLADVDNGNRGVLSNFLQDGTTVSFGVDVVLVPVERGDNGFIVDASRTEMNFSGVYSGTFSDVD